MGVADLIKKFDSTANSGSENINIKIFQPDQLSALAKSGLKVSGESSNSSPKKSKNRGVGIATGSRTVFVSEPSKPKTGSPAAEVRENGVEKEEPVIEEAVEQEPVIEDSVAAEEEAAVGEEATVEEEQPVEEHAAENEAFAEEEPPVEEEEPVVEEEQPVAEEKEIVVEEELAAEEEPAVEETPAEEEPAAADEQQEEEIPAEEPVADEEIVVEEEAHVEEETPAEETAAASSTEAASAAQPTEKNTPNPSLRQEQKEEEQEEEKQKVDSDSENTLYPSTEYLESTKNISKPPLDTRLGRDDPFTFGTRYLPEDENAIWDFNSWDHFKFTQEDIDLAESKIKLQQEVVDKEKYLDDNAYKHWDKFYSQHKENFFKDRKWLPIEFPVLSNIIEPNYGPVKVLEVGCGVGNTFNCILRDNKNPQLEIHALDYSYTAIDLIKESEFYQQENEKGIAFADRWDICDSESLPVEPNSVDLIIMIFVFSALEPKQWEQTIKNCSKLLKKGGQILFRDYGRYDLAQVRFKGERILQDNFYIRGDGTRVYFFTENEIDDIFTQGDEFEKIKIGIDRRLLVNRKKKIKMYRQWVQAVFEKK